MSRYTMKQLKSIRGYMNFTEQVHINMNKEIKCLQECDGCKHFCTGQCPEGDEGAYDLDGCESYAPSENIQQTIKELNAEYNKVGQYASYCCMCKKCAEDKCDFNLYAPDDTVYGDCKNYKYWKD